MTSFLKVFKNAYTLSFFKLKFRAVRRCCCPMLSSMGVGGRVGGVGGRYNLKLRYQ